MQLKILIIASALLLYSCSTFIEKDFKEVVVDSGNSEEQIKFFTEEINTTSIKQVIKKESILLSFYYGIIKKNNQYYFVFCNKENSIVFVSLTGKVVKTSLNESIKPSNDFYPSTLCGDRLFVLDYKKNVLHSFQLSENFEIVLLKSYDLSSHFKNGRFARGTRHATNLYYQEPFIFINIGNVKNKNSNDRQALMIIDLNNINTKPKFAVSYPEQYKKDKIYYSELLFQGINNKDLAYCFTGSDVFGKLELNPSMDFKSKVNHECRIDRFNADKEQNLGYIQNFIETNETNYKLLVSKAQNLFLFKQLKRNKKADIIQMECFVFDQNLQSKFNFRLEDSINQVMIFNYKEGFLAFKKDLSKAYYYEIN